MNIAYLGYNSFKTHKRGVENVIDFQSKCCNFDLIFYLHWGDKTCVYKCGEFIVISIKKCWRWPIVLNLVLRKLKRRHVFIHSHNSLFSIVSLQKTDLLTVHDGLYYQTSSSGYRLKMLFWLLEKVLYTRCTMVHFISEYTKKQTLFDKWRCNFRIIPNSSHFESLVSADFVSSTSEAQINHCFMVLSVRSVEERARFDLLIEVAEELQDKGYHFVVAGKGPLLEHYREIIRSKHLVNIELLGYVDDQYLLNLYEKCDLVLSLAEYGEGFGLPIIEGYLFNKPVVASNCCAIPEVIIDKVYLCENQVKDIVKKVQMYIGNPEGTNFRKYYFECFSNKYIAQQLRKIVQGTDE